MTDRRTRLALAIATVAVSWTGAASGQVLDFSPPVFLPGDNAIGTPVGMQVEADIARGGNQFLAVWTAQAIVAKFMASFKDYPPRQKPASFNVGDALSQLQTATQGR